MKLQVWLVQLWKNPYNVENNSNSMYRGSITSDQLHLNRIVMDDHIEDRRLSLGAKASTVSFKV